MKNLRAKILFSGLIVLILVGGFLTAGAAPTGLTIQPVKVFYTLNPGDIAEDEIILSNPNDEPVFVTTSVEDFVPDPGTSSIKFVGRAEGVTTVRDWIKQEFTDFRLEGKAQKKMPFKITVPKNAEPGSHFGILFFKAVPLDSDKGQLNIGTRVGVLAFVTVPGDFLQKGKLHGVTGPTFVQKGPVSFTIDFENTGTVHYEPRGTITITNFGAKVAEIPVQGNIVLPTGRRNILVNWSTSKLLFGFYKAQVEIKDGEGNVLTADVHKFYAFPIFYALGLFAVLTALYFGFKYLKSKINISIKFKK
jgi:hypothetical protein